jgi:hypothetical protein
VCAIGLYSLTWAFLPLYHWKPKHEQIPPAVTGSMILNEQYGFDDHSTAVLTWKDGLFSPSGTSNQANM